MRSQIGKWGNSLALRLPRGVAERLGLQEGASVELDIADGTLIVAPAAARLQLQDLLAQMPDNAADAETDWGEPRGAEAW